MRLYMLLMTLLISKYSLAAPPPPSPGKRWVVVYDRRAEKDIHGAVGNLGATIVNAFNITYDGVAAFERPDDNKPPGAFSQSLEALLKRPGRYTVHRASACPRLPV